MTKLALALGALVMAGGAMAATDTANLAVGATVVNACAIGPGAIAYAPLALEVNAGAGTVTPVNHDADSGTSISVVCTLDASATITADWGANATATPRKMLSGSDELAYTLYTTADRTIELTPSVGIAYTGTGAATTATKIYARITGAQLAAAKKGTYTDTVAMLITYTP